MIAVPDFPPQASDRLVEVLRDNARAESQISNSSRNHELAVPSVEVLQKLSESATSILAEVAREASLDGSRSPDIAFVEDLLRVSAMNRQW